MIHGIQHNAEGEKRYKQQSAELSCIIVLEALECPSINDKTIAPHLNWDIQTFPKGKGYIAKQAQRLLGLLSRKMKFCRFPKQDNIGTLLRYVTSCYM